MFSLKKRDITRRCEDQVLAGGFRPVAALEAKSQPLFRVMMGEQEILQRSSDLMEKDVI